MRTEHIEKRLMELLSVQFATMFYRDEQFVIYSPIGREPCTGFGSTIQTAIFNYDQARKRLVEGPNISPTLSKILDKKIRKR